MYFKLINEAERLLREAVASAGYAADDMGITESAHADVSSSLPFKLAKELRKNPKEIAHTITSRIGKSEYISKVEVAGAYINFFASDRYIVESLTAIRDPEKRFYKLDNNGIKVILEHTSANPTGPLHVGRGRNPIIGDTLSRIMRNAGYDVEVQYYVDDMGKQEATIVWGYENLDLSKLKPEIDKPDHQIVEIYRAATDRRKADPAVEKEVSDILNRYEHADPEVSMKLKKFVGLCLEGQRMTLDRMNVFYDRFVWESGFVFDGEVERIVKQLSETPYARRNADGSLELDLTSFGMDKAFVLTRADGTSLYTTRDIAYHVWKLSNCDMAVNVLGEDQKLAMQRLEAALKIIGQTKFPTIVFYSFISLPEGRMSTRKGVVVNMDDLLDEAIVRARAEVDKRREDLTEEKKNKIAEAVGIGAVRFDIIRVAPEKSITFKWEQALDFEKQGAPFIQYSHARACSILEKAPAPAQADLSLLKEDQEVALIKKMAMLPYVVRNAATELKPHYVATYARELADSFNQFYRFVPVLIAEPGVREARLALVDAGRIALAASLEMLGVEAVEEM